MSNTRLSLSQEALVLAHLRKHGYITPAVALTEYGNARLAATINRLRTTHAHLITTNHEIVTQVRTSEAGVRYARYSFETSTRVTLDAAVRPSARGRVLERAAA